MPGKSSVIFGNQSKHVERYGRNFLVVPGVPVQEQVMNTYLLPADEIEKHIRAWDGTPLSIGHAKLNGGSVNVPNPDVPIIGTFYNTKWDPETKRMLGEYWIDIDKAMETPDGQSIITALHNEKILETSTAYWADEQHISGEFNGRRYATIHRNLRPDHIAIFADETPGACSVDDGCGVNRNMKHNCSCSIHNQVVQNVTGNLPASGKKLWEKVYEASKANGDSEEVAAKKAWSACKRAGWQKSGDEWVKTNNMDIPGYQKGHLPTKMLEGYSFAKGSRTMDQVEGLRDIVAKKGIEKPIWLQVDEDGSIKILDGAHRVSLASEFGINQVPVHVVNHLFDDMDPEPLYMKWMHDQDRSYLNSTMNHQGGRGSGNFGHKGRPGQVGGSSSKSRVSISSVIELRRRIAAKNGDRVKSEQYKLLGKRISEGKISEKEAEEYLSRITKGTIKTVELKELFLRPT